jgi:DNA-binding LacI/PurR family transcriptional regulator
MAQQLHGGVAVTKLPFKIRREDGASLTDQFASGLRYAIHSGSLHSGDALPTLTEMAAQTGVSAIVVRHAVKSLANEGLLHVRHGCGITVNGLGGQGWRASVLGLHWSTPTMYYQSVLSSVVTERLNAANVLFEATYIGWKEESKGFPKVQAQLAHAFSLAVVRGSTGGIEKLLSHRGIPFIHFTSSDPSPRAVRAIHVHQTAVFSEVRDHCLPCGVRKVLLVCLRGESAQDSELRNLLTDAGMRCRVLNVQDAIGLENPECVERGAFSAIDIWLQRERQLPDLIWFGDDFVARGALTALTARGVRIPEDVQMITWANKGFVPVSTKPLTRVEMEPVRYGEAIAACVLEQLEGKPWDGKPIELAPVFIEGATTVKKVQTQHNNKRRYV